MGFYYTCFIAIGFCLTLMVVQNFGDLIVLRHPSNKNSGKRLLTCLSGDDDSALVWNYNCRTNGTNRGVNIINDFPPKILGSKNVSGCAIWNSVTCIANWEQPFQWDVVNSDKKPTSPVFDYRWEGFKEFVFEETIAGHKYVDTGNVEGNSGTVVFSVRALQDVNIYLCKKKNVEKNRCFWINIGREHGRQSKIFTCVGGALKPGANEECEVIAETGHESMVVDAYEWRTFRIEWKSEEQTVKLFKETELEPFLVGIVQKWHNVSHIFLSSEISSRVRFHFYDYILTEKKNTELFTQQFRQESRDFCVELLVGLCSNCQLTVRLIDESGHPIATNSISGNKDSAKGALLSWKSIKLVKSLKGSMPKFVKIKIQTILNGTKGTGQWAVDNFRVCKLDGSLRSSTITTREEQASSDLWPIVRCQKISYSESAIVDSLSKNKIHRETSRLRQLFRKTQLFHSYKMSIEKWFICNPTGCACDRGYKSADCATQCSGGSYGYDCNESCGSCSSGNCDVVNGNCNTGCRSDRLLPPLCKEIEQPIIEDITDTTARLFQKVEPELSTYIIDFRHVITESSGKGSGSILSSTVNVGSTFTINFKQLRPGTTYRVHTIVTTQFEHTFENPKIGGNVTVQSLEINFTTTRQCCLKVVPNKNSINLDLQRDFNLEGCEAFSDRPYYLEIKGPENFHSNYGTRYLPLDYQELDSYTEYELFVSRDGIPSWTKKVRTLPSAPEKVRKLRLPYLSDTKVILQWDAPLKVNGVITKYIVSIKRTTLCGCQELGKPTPVKNETIKEVKDTIASFSGLNPYAEYRATVIAHTTEPGSENTIKFQTPEADIQTSVVTNLKLINNQSRLKWDKPQDCRKITASIKLTRLVFTGVSDSVQNWTINRTTTFDYFDLFELRLAHYTTYNVRVYVLKSNGLDVNPDLYREMNWTTAPTAPSPIENLVAYDTDPDTNTVSLRWEPPNPANGEIESYYVTITETSAIKEWTVKASEGIQACEYWENYVCIENLTLRSDAPNVVLVKISARNKNVEAAGSQATFYIAPGLDYNKAPGVPINLTAIHEGHGNVIVTWIHPSESKTKITRFEIIVDILKTNLLENLNMQYLTVNHSIVKNQKYYSEILSLPPSTYYKVSVMAVNGRGQKSSAINTEVVVPSSINSVTENKPLVNFDGTSIDVKIPTVVNATSNTTVKVIVKGLSKCTPKSSPQNNETRSVMEWDAAVYQVGTEIPKPLRIYAGRNEAVSSICYLDLKEKYTIVFNVTDWYSGTSVINTTSPIALSNPSEPQKSNLAWLIIFPIIAICVIFFLWHRKHSKAPLKTSQQNIIQLESTAMRTGHSSTPAILKLETLPQKRSPIRQSSPDVVPTYNPNSNPVKVEEFEEYTKEALATGLLDSQFESFPQTFTKPCDHATMPENVQKNRYKDRIPYDETRVVLNKINKDPHSDYINASYIQGYRKKRGYIATQGPKSKTVIDFWRMIWQENVRVICMLANLVEGGKRKCEQYWPEIGTKVTHGKITISNTSHMVFADYTFRSFTLCCQKETREVTHLHYTGWPDHGVPKYTQSLVAYLKKLLATPAGSGPVVVHCSAGVGRTGTIILCDICLREAVAERTINVPATILRMREDRPNMIDNAQQYLLAHLAIVESMVIEQTQIPCTSSLPKKIMELKKQLPSDIQRLNETVWQDRALHLLGSPSCQRNGDAATSRNSGLLPVSPAVDRLKITSTYVNENNSTDAVHVDGVKMRNQYFASRLPANSGLSDLWKLIAEKNIELVVILQRPGLVDLTYCEFVPGESALVLTENIQVERKSIPDEEEHFIIDKLLLTDTSMEEVLLQPVTVITCTGWGYGRRGKPPSPVALVSLWMASEKIARQEGPTLVLCQDGVTGCGLYLALSFLLERISVERECDVISAVRAVRRSRPEFVQSLEQFEYLYDAAVEYVKCFEIYANFS